MLILLLARLSSDFLDSLLDFGLDIIFRSLGLGLTLNRLCEIERYLLVALYILRHLN